MIGALPLGSFGLDALSIQGLIQATAGLVKMTPGSPGSPDVQEFVARQRQQQGVKQIRGFRPQIPGAGLRPTMPTALFGMTHM